MKKIFSLVTLASVLFLNACQHEPPNPIKAPTNPSKSPKKGPSTSSAKIATHVSPVNYLDTRQRLLVIAGDNLYSVDAATRIFQHMATGFSGTEVLSWADDYLVYTQSDHLYRYNPFNGEHVMLGSGWYGTEHMTSTGAAVVAIHQGTMYGVSHITGHATSWRVNDNGDWTGTVDLAYSSPTATSGRIWGIQGGNEWGYTLGSNSKLVSIRALHGLTSAYIVRNNSAGTPTAYYVYGNQLKAYNVYGTNPVAITNLGTTDWSGTTAMSFAGGHLWILKSGIIYQVNPNTGQVVGTVNIPGAYIIESFACNC